MAADIINYISNQVQPRTVGALAFLAFSPSRLRSDFWKLDPIGSFGAGAFHPYISVLPCHSFFVLNLLISFHLRLKRESRLFLNRKRCIYYMCCTGLSAGGQRGARDGGAGRQLGRQLQPAALPGGGGRAARRGGGPRGERSAGGDHLYIVLGKHRWELY